VGQSAAWRRALEMVDAAATTDSVVLLRGESGTGKELLARRLHLKSARAGGPYVLVNGAAVPLDMWESEFFGHRRGAFTGATADREGWFQLADRGTLFLDEVGAMPGEAQAKLLRVIQDGEFHRLGDQQPTHVDVRLVAATNADLESEIKDGRFRADLYYRLNVLQIRVPPLRERPEDIPLLVRHFVAQYARRMQRTIDTIPAATMDALCRYPWPGNIRELQNCLERAVIVSPGPVLQVPLDDLRSGALPSPEPGQRQTLEESDRALILATLQETQWVLAGPKGAAVRLGLNRSTLAFRMKKLGIVRPWQAGEAAGEAPWRVRMG
jgi:formate hydrogenlyase transcriptional activator